MFKNKLLLPILFFAAAISNSFAQQKDSINWISFEQLSDSLTVNPKKVLLFFHTDWCAYCRKMQSATLSDPEVVHELNANYYAVSFDAEQVDTVHFDGRAFANEVSKKRTGSYHALTKLLAPRGDKFVFPTTIILDKDFAVEQRYFNYLDKKKFLKAIR